MKSNTKIQYLDILQVFRGIAALMVVVHHSVGSIKYYHKINLPLLDFIAALGKYGVDFFFVLSGFIIAYSSYLKMHQPNAFKQYIQNRIIRIYVPYLPVGIVMLLLYMYFPGFSNSNRDVNVITSFTLLPFGNPALSVAWTLLYELLFYLLFGIAFYSVRLWHLFLFLWMSFIVWVNYLGFQLNTTVRFFNILTSPYNIEFGIGYLLSILIINNLKISPKLNFSIAISLIVLFLIAVYNKMYIAPFSLNLLFTAAIFFVFYFSINYYSISWSRQNLMMLIGNATFSIYLLHNPLQAVFIRFYPKVQSLYELFCLLFLVILFSIIIGYIYYLIFEKHAIRLIKTKLK